MTPIDLGHYTLIQEMNAGGTARIFLGVDNFSGYPVAVKELMTAFSNNEMMQQQFIQEANEYLYLRHPNIVSLRDFIQHEKGVYLVMEYIDGKNLTEYMQRETGPLPVMNAALFVSEVLDALQYAHTRGLMHLDLKPANIMLSNTNAIKLIDFGIAKKGQENNNEQVMGSPAYMSPEQTVQGQMIDHRSDIYSMGVTMFELVTGSVPYPHCTTKDELFDCIRHKPLPEVRVHNPIDIEHLGSINEVLKKATAKNPNDRYQTCDQFKHALGIFLS